MPLSQKTTNLDDVLAKFGMFEPYHRRLIFLLFLVYTFNGAFGFHYVFAAEEIDYRCINEVFGNRTGGTINSTVCTEWVYENPNSFVGEFQLAGQEWKRTLVGTVYSVGYMVGLLFVGPFSDRYGRKTAMIIMGVSGAIIGLVKSYTNWYWMYIGFAFLESSIVDLYTPTFVLNIEIVQSESRVQYFLISGLGASIGVMSVALIAWQVPYWRHFLRVIYAPTLLIIFYTLLIDESPRWLLIKGKRDKALDVIEKIADTNKIKIKKHELENLVCDTEEEKVPFRKLLKNTFVSRELIKRFLVCVIWWITSTFVYYSMAINSVSLQGNKYLNYALTSATEIPGNFITMHVMVRFGRKIPLIFSFIGAGLFCIAQPFCLIVNLPWLSITAFMAGKLITVVFVNITNIYTSELFPTYTRNSMYGLCTSLGRIGAMIASQTPLLQIYWSGLPSLILGVMPIIAGLATFSVPEIESDNLPDTIRQAEALGINKNIGRERNMLRDNNEMRDSSGGDLELQKCL